MRVKGDEQTILHADNHLCPACQGFRQHTKEEWEKHHPQKGTDFSREHGTPKPKDR